MPIGSAIAYTIGYSGINVSWYMINSYLMIFYTDIVGLAAGAISMIMLIARIWDAINDPMMGAIVDRTRSRWGKFKPYIAIAPPFLAIFNILTFTVFPIQGAAKVAVCLICYILVGMAYTAVQVAVNGLVNRLTRSSQTKMDIISMSQIGSALIQTLLGALVPVMLLAFSRTMVEGAATPDQRSYFITTIIVSIAMIPMFWFCAWKAKEIKDEASEVVKEKTGWTGDIQVYAPTACYEMDVEQFLRHWLADMRNEQLPDGQMPHIIPYIPSHDIMKPAWIDGVSAGGWSDACVIVPWRLYEAYGDTGILEENYEMMHRYMTSCKARVAANPANCESTGEHLQYIWNNDFQYGDWLMPSAVKSGLSGPPMMMLTGFEAGTLMYAYTNMLMAKICRVLGKDAEADEYADTYHKVCEAFMIEFGNEDGTLKKDFQGLYVLALQMGAIPEDKRQNAVNKLVSLIHENDDRLDTGFLSIPFLLPLLADSGQAPLANTLLFQDKAPSWLYEIKCGATTLWESWDAIDEEGNPKHYSMNHFAFGCVAEYLFKYIAGIRPVTPGFREVRIEPDFTCGLKEVLASYDSIMGKITVHWKNYKGEKFLDVKLPPNVKGVTVIDGVETEI